MKQNIHMLMQMDTDIQFTLKQIATINSPFCDLVDMPVQPKGGSDVYATIEFDDKYKEGLSDLDGFVMFI